MKLPRWVTCHPEPVKSPPDTSPTDVPFVRESKIKAPFAEGGGEDGGGAPPPVLAGGGGLVVPLGGPADEPCAEPIAGEGPENGVDGSSRLQLATNATAPRSKSRARVLKFPRLRSGEVGKVRFYLSGTVNGLRRAIGSFRSIVNVMRKNNDSTNGADPPPTNGPLILLSP
jgi:hypothetical protein